MTEARLTSDVAMAFRIANAADRLVDDLRDLMAEWRKWGHAHNRCADDLQRILDDFRTGAAPPTNPSNRTEVTGYADAQGVTERNGVVKGSPQGDGETTAATHQPETDAELERDLRLSFGPRWYR